MADGQSGKVVAGPEGERTTKDESGWWRMFEEDSGEFISMM
jgi:hypothetical protein